MTRDDLLAGVASAPDDDTPRLAFADYLEESGDAEWAELIRLQVGFFRDWTNFPEVERRERELLRLTVSRFENPTGCQLGPPRRGFPARLAIVNPPGELDAERDYAGAFAWPITWLRFPVGTVDLPAEAVARMEVLEVLPVSVGETAVVARLGDFNFLAHAHPNRLRALFWCNQQLNDDAAQVLAAEPTLGGLSELDLHGNAITDAGAARLIASPHLQNLEYINLAGNPIARPELLERRFGTALRLV